MVHWNIFQLVTWLDRCVARIYTEMLIEIKKISTMQKRLENVGPNGWIMFEIKIVHMLLILIPLKICMILTNTYLLFVMLINNLIHGKYITLMTNHLKMNVVYSFVQMYVLIYY